MASNKTSSRKPREAAADVAGQAPETTAAAPVKKARKTAAAPKKATKAAAPATRHRKTAIPASDAVAVTVPAEQAAQAEVGEAVNPPMAMAAASGAGAGSIHSDAVSSVGQMTEPQAVGTANIPASEQVSQTGITQEEIAALAHSYWVARGYQHGSHEEDWLRAEQELKSRRR